MVCSEKKGGGVTFFFSDGNEWLLYNQQCDEIADFKSYILAQSIQNTCPEINKIRNKGILELIQLFENHALHYH